MDQDNPVQSPPRPGLATDQVHHWQLPPVPPMRIVTKGWWTLREDQAKVEDLEKADSKRA